MSLPTLDFNKRRRQLLQAMEPDSIAVLPSALETIRNRDVHYPFRQDSDFLYMTGFYEPDAVAVFIPGRDQGEFILFCREKDELKETWEGRRAGQQGAVDHYGADDAFSIDSLDEILPHLMENKTRVFYTMGRSSSFDSQMIEWLNEVRSNARMGVKAPNEFVSLDYLIHEMRLFKSGHELSYMRQAANISAEAHKRAMQACIPGKTEYQIAAELDYWFQQHNCGQAYPSIVGGGANACILHYTENQDVLNDGDLLLIDAGCELQGYASDITRTFPVNGEFSSVQRDVYEIVLEAQLAAIDKCQVGYHWNDAHEAAVHALTKGLLHIGLLDGDLKTNIKEGHYRQFYLHRTGHWLGLDVHDVGDYKVHDDWRVLEAGMCMTVEPGLYIPAKASTPKAFHNIGIRIEDDVVVKRKGNEVLTRRVPKDVKSIEALVGSLQVQAA